MTPRRTLALAALLGLFTACEGAIADPGASPGGGGAPRREGTPPASSRAARLTHAQYERTVRDLVGVAELSPASAFLADPTRGGFDNDASELVVSPRLARDYRRAAKEIALRVARTPADLDRVLACTGGAALADCARAFVVRFGRRAFRRPLDPATVDRYTALFLAAPTLGPADDPRALGTELVLEAMLQSPRFLYRTELSTRVDGGAVTLDAWELASRLSYMLWGTMPNDALLTRAERGELATDEQLRSVAREMLEDPRAEFVVRDFHAQWLEVDRYDDLTRDAELFPEFRPELGAVMREETLAYVNDVVFAQEGGLRALLTTPATFVNRDLAPLYGLSGSFGEDLERVELDPAERAGLLTQTGFLASRAFIRSSSPIHRGVFVHRKILCTELPDPPGDVDLELPPIMGSIRTTRDQVETHTAAPRCQGCHGVINPAGFAFEHFDAVGRARELDNGYPIDATGSMVVDGTRIYFDGAVDFARKIAETHAARRCYAQQWLRYAYGRANASSDEATLESLAERLGEPTFSVKDLLEALTTTRAFRSRAREELE